MECLFCDIVNKKKPADIVFENDKVVAFKDINPKASVHLLVVPKKHVDSISHLKEEDKALMADLMMAVQKIGKEKRLEGYKLIINVGRKGGQLIDHLHIHLLSGRPIRMP